MRFQLITGAVIFKCINVNYAFGLAHGNFGLSKAVIPPAKREEIKTVKPVRIITRYLVFSRDHS